MHMNDHRAFTIGDLVPESQVKVPTAFEKAQAEYEARLQAEALAKAQRDEEYKKIKTYTVIGASVLALVTLVLFIKRKS